MIDNFMQGTILPVFELPKPPGTLHTLISQQ